MIIKCTESLSLKYNYAKDQHFQLILSYISILEHYQMSFGSAYFFPDSKWRLEDELGEDTQLSGGCNQVSQILPSMIRIIVLLQQMPEEHTDWP